MVKGANKSGVGKVFLFFVLSFVVMIVWQISVHVASTIYYEHSLGTRELAAKAIENNMVLNQIFNISMELALLLFIYVFVKKVDKQPFSLMNFDINKKQNAVKFIAVGLLISFIIKIVAVFGLITSGTLHYKSLGFASFSGNEVIGYTLLMLFSTLFPGVIEEILYRGYIQKQLTNRKGPLFGLIVSTFLFTISHSVLYGFSISLVTVFVLGLFLGILYMKTNSLLLPIGFHYGWDFTNHLFDDGKEAALFQFSPITGSTANILSLTFIALIILFILVFTFILNKKGEINTIAK